MDSVGGLLRNHVHVGLHDHTLAVLHPRSRRGCEYDVARLVTLDVDAIVLSPLEKVLLYLAFML